MIIFDLMNM